MRCIIAGSRQLIDALQLETALSGCGFRDEITEVLSGGAAGVDRMGEWWAAQRGIPCRHFLADWTRHAVAGLLHRGRDQQRADVR